MIWDGFVKDPELTPNWIQPAWIQSSRGYFGHWQTTWCSCLERIAACMDWTRETPRPVPWFQVWGIAVEMQHYLQSFGVSGRNSELFCWHTKIMLLFEKKKRGWNSYTKMSISHLQKCQRNQQNPPNFFPFGRLWSPRCPAHRLPAVAHPSRYLRNDHHKYRSPHAPFWRSWRHGD